MYTDDDPEMREKIRAALKSQLVSTYGNDYLSPEATRSRAEQLRTAYGTGEESGSGGRWGSAPSTKQTDYRAHECRPAELVNSMTRYGAREAQVPRYESGVLPREALNKAFLGPGSQQQLHQTTYKAEISDLVGGRVPSRDPSGVAGAEAELIRWRHPQWEGPVGPVAKIE